MEDLVKFQYNRLVTDPIIQTLMEHDIVTTPIIRLVESDKDSDFPYIIQQFTQNMIEDTPFFYEGLADFHIWSYGPSKQPGYDIRNRVFALFERLYYPVIDNVSSVRYRFKSQHWVPEPDSRTHHLVMRFGIRWVANSDLQAVLDREGV